MLGSKPSAAPAPCSGAELRAAAGALFNTEKWCSVQLRRPKVVGRQWGGPMLGLMQRYPLLISSLITHAARHRGGTEVVSNLGGPTLHRTTYAEVERRSRRLARALGRLGVGFGDRVATLAWNDFRHLELYYGVSGMGAVCHTVNPRLSAEDIAFIMTDAEDCILFADPSFARAYRRDCAGGERLRSRRRAADRRGRHEGCRAPPRHETSLLRDAAGRGRRGLCVAGVR